MDLKTNSALAFFGREGISETNRALIKQVRDEWAREVSYISTSWLSSLGYRDREEVQTNMYWSIPN